MCKLYKTINKIFYAFAKLLFISSLAAVPTAIAYLIFASTILKLSSSEIFENNILIYFTAYVMTALISGSQIAKKYEKFKLKNTKDFKESNFFEFSFDVKK
jgi:hypothetical protein